VYWSCREGFPAPRPGENLMRGEPPVSRRKEESWSLSRGQWGPKKGDERFYVSCIPQTGREAALHGSTLPGKEGSASKTQDYRENEKSYAHKRVSSSPSICRKRTVGQLRSGEKVHRCRKSGSVSFAGGGGAIRPYPLLVPFRREKSMPSCSGIIKTNHPHKAKGGSSTFCLKRCASFNLW